MNVQTLLRRPKHFVRTAIQRALLPALERQGGDSFAGSVLAYIAEHRRKHIADPVLDTYTFPNIRAKRFKTEAAHRVLTFIRDNSDAIDCTAALLADDESRDLLKQLLAYRALGPRHVALPRAPHYRQRFAKARAMLNKPSTSTFPPYEMGHYAIPIEQSEINVECWLGNAYIFTEEQYYFFRNGVSVRPEPGDVLIDAGGCFGDTALAFAATVGPSGIVHSFEPLPSQQEIFERNLISNSELKARVRIHPFALDEVSGKVLTFSAGAGARPTKKAGVNVTTITLDEFVERESLDRVDFIKMDIEGAETGALKGGVNTIRKHRPRLGISIYHSLDDLIMLPQIVKQIEAGYELYIDHHTIFEGETVLYAKAA